jgi:hypothetical protein
VGAEARPFFPLSEEKLVPAFFAGWDEAKNATRNETSDDSDIDNHDHLCILVPHRDSEDIGGKPQPVQKTSSKF